jgi:hypothetical protein
MPDHVKLQGVEARTASARSYETQTAEVKPGLLNRTGAGGWSTNDLLKWGGIAALVFVLVKGARS